MCTRELSNVHELWQSREYPKTWFFIGFLIYSMLAESVYSEKLAYYSPVRIDMWCIGVIRRNKKNGQIWNQRLWRWTDKRGGKIMMILLKKIVYTRRVNILHKWYKLRLADTYTTVMILEWRICLGTRCGTQTIYAHAYVQFIIHIYYAHDVYLHLGSYTLDLI